MKDIKIELNIKSIILFEHLSGKSFYQLNDNDMVLLLYSIIVANNNNYKATINEFENVMKNKKLVLQMVADLQEELNFEQSLCGSNGANSKQEEPSKEEEEPIMITDVIGGLITTFHLDVNYIMEKMRLWELTPLFKSIEQSRHSEMEEKRFWSFLNILPHIDNKKIKTPQDLLPYPWEEDSKDKASEFLKKNSDKINNLFKSQEDE